jgi:hypothetical protein
MPNMTETQKQSRCKLLADMAKKIMADPEATISQKLEAMGWYDKHRNIRPGSKGNAKNLRNQKPKKTVDYAKLLGVKKEE